MIPGFAGGFLSTSSLSAADIITNLALTSNWVLCLDAGDSASYASGQQWTDLSGGNNHFNRGTTSGADATDPTYNGVAGGLSANEYWSNDGGDRFTESAAHTAFDAWHKNNGAFTLVAVVRPVNASVDGGIFQNSATASDHGIEWEFDGGQVQLSIYNGSGSTALAHNATALPTQSVWNFIAIALNEATGASGGTSQINGTQQSFTSTYTSPSATNPSSATTAFTSLDAGSRMALLLGWSTRLSDANLTSLYQALKPRFAFP